MNKKDIFEDIVKQLSGCQYISDLRVMMNAKNFLELSDVLNNLCVDDYTVHQWSELYHYLFEDDVKFTTSQEVYSSVLERLKK